MSSDQVITPRTGRSTHGSGQIVDIGKMRMAALAQSLLTPLAINNKLTTRPHQCRPRSAFSVQRRRSATSARTPEPQG